MSASPESGRKRARLAALALALACALHAASAAAALVFGQVSGVDFANDRFEVVVGNKRVPVIVKNYSYEVVLPPGSYTAVYKNRHARIVSSSSSRRQDLAFR